MPAAKQVAVDKWMKHCRECGKDFIAKDYAGFLRWFYSNPRNKDGLSGYCKTCSSNRAKQRQAAFALIGRRLSGL